MRLEGDRRRRYEPSWTQYIDPGRQSSPHSTKAAHRLDVLARVVYLIVVVATIAVYTILYGDRG